MSYQIGQFRGHVSGNADLQNYFNEDILNRNKKITEYQQTSSDVNDISFQDCYFEPKSSNFVGLNNQNCYYLKFAVKQISNSDQAFSLKLENNLTEQLIEEFSIKKGSGTKYFETIIAPNSNYEKIVWELKRTREDYSGTSSRKMTVTVQTYGILTNIISSINYSGLKSLKKVGIQGPPSMLMCINREPIRIGRSGIYEINKNNISINSISFMPKKNDYFIMDFEYQKKEDN